MILTSTGELDKGNRNHLLYEFRLNYGSDEYSNTVEWLFQLGRHWALWQSARIGTFPLDMRDYWGPVDRATSDETGEDSTYWAIDDILRVVIEDAGGQVLNNVGSGWTYTSRHPRLLGDLVQDHLVHTTAVLTRLLHLLEGEGYAY